MHNDSERDWIQFKLNINMASSIPALIPWLIDLLHESVFLLDPLLFNFLIKVFYIVIMM